MSNKLKQLRAKEGFTIIEVIIVLVIGAVIMLAVFLVVPQLQRTQRDSRRSSEARRVVAAMEQYASANSGSYPTVLTNVYPAYTATLTDPSGATVSSAITVATSAATTTSPATAATAATPYVFYSNATCDGKNVIFSSGANKIAVSVFQENGSSAICINN